jgi:hypothetical protein
MAIIRRFDCILADKNAAIEKIIATASKVKSVTPAQLEEMVKRQCSVPFYNAKCVSLEQLVGDSDNLNSNFLEFIKAYSPSVQKILQDLKFKEDAEYRLSDETIHSHSWMASAFVECIPEKAFGTKLEITSSNPDVIAVKMIFLTADDADYAGLRTDAKKTRDITLTLSKILEGMATDCHSCNLREICDEVEGLKELHFGKEKKEFKG